MAVAVKNPPISGMSSPFDRLPVVSLIGAAYVVVSLGIVLSGLPYVWRNVLGWTDPLYGNLFLGLVMLAALVGLAVLGARLFGANRPAGARAGVFFGVIGFLIVLLLTRWASVWIEYWIFTNHWLGDRPEIGLALTGVVAVVLLIGEGYLFFRPRMQSFLVAFEAQGWLTASSYKGQQGQRVRRGTILGILLIGGSGVYTMINNGFLRRMPDSLYLNIPFTGAAPIANMGDAEFLLKDPKRPKNQVQIVSKGDAASLAEGALVSVQDYKNKLKEIIDRANIVGSAPHEEEGRAAGGDKELPLDATTKQWYMQKIADDDITALVNLPSPSMAAGAAFGPTALAVVPPAGLPTALVCIDPYVLRNVNAELRSQYVLVTDARQSNLKTGAVVPRKDFDDQVERLTKLGQKPPEGGPPYPAIAKASISERLTLLPALQYTLPVLLIALALWVGWRVVNYPAFADFLIATEAELNKVSWITRPRLIQDTIVVLVTVFLLALFLFSMDQLWRVVLSNWPVNVLQINRDQNDQSAEDKPW
ncbi:MAG TPA: preprotein translocase subunit SecE [Gemmataceae bacterium]|nr:preprotein translocase subunit SecE [Gemmataceae bacterium]